ncbi:hypothetical protein AN639_07200 [Candidatus Epulonipiscium fishelsonii]|uniref:Uncharacterized protein n=1 Tax=Candidatus Epulonipiscium fishelsonii TaxID=77094 RepID=A0ACC8X9X2_9FIRM|nr:hypothetical protein AN639_07200 [Epulopiscium sp. SCG-B05WGA-EpuloA1]ONI39037.1 hypothetical protein AN396_09180 [Epulopiscium sp. SCG-B11WGA-EpuloA1]
MKKFSKIPNETNGIEIKKTICTICDPGTQCGLNLYIKDGEIIKVEGDENQPAGQGTLCSKGAATRQYVYNPDRIKTPLRRVGERGSGKFEPITWEEAYKEIAEKFNLYKEESGAESVVFFSGYTKFYRPWLKRLCHSFGSPNYLAESSSCYLSTYIAHKLTYGMRGDPSWAGGMKCAIIWSSNPYYTNPGAARVIENAKKNGVKLIVVDPRITPTTKRADIHLRVRPGTDGALAHAMANVMINENIYDKEYVAKYTYGFEEYKEYVQEFTPERAEEITGVPANLIREAARTFATTKPSGIMTSAAPVVQNSNGVQNYRAIFSLLGLTGNFDKLGGQMVSPSSFLHASGQFKSRQVEFRQSRPVSEMATRIGDTDYPVWKELIEEEGQAVALPDHIISGKPYPLRAVIGFGMNFRMLSESTKMAEALKKLDFFVDVDLFLTDTAKLADIVLPACSSVERSEFRCWGTGFATCTKPAIEPLYESRSDIDIICQLAKYIAPEDKLLASGFEPTLDWILEGTGMTTQELWKHPSGMPVPNPIKQAPLQCLEHGFKTPSGKLEFVSKVLEKYEHLGYDALPTYKPPKYSPQGSPEIAKDYPFILNTGARLPMFVHTRMYRVPWTNSLRPNPAADISPVDADKLGVKQGDKIRISTPLNSIEVLVNVTAIALEGVVHMYHGHSQADVNSLFDRDNSDPITGYPAYKSMLCKIEKI